MQMKFAMLLLCHSILSAQGAPPSIATFVVRDSNLHSPLTLILYGDQRFMDPNNNSQSSPVMRQLLVKQIAAEKPAALILNGDVPNDGRNKDDYAVYQSESKVWRDEKLLVLPALGNHEIIGEEAPCLENWWTAFPELRGKRWYSMQLGSRIYVIALDSMSSLLPASEQAKWLAKQLDGISSSVDFVVISIHHPPVADVQIHILTNHNPRPNEIALRDYLTEKAKTLHARILVSAGHIHNYERREQAGVTYLVSGGGGAFPYIVERTAGDLYQDTAFPNYHYLKCALEGPNLTCNMYRATEPESLESKFEKKDSFVIGAKAAAARKAAAAAVAR